MKNDFAAFYQLSEDEFSQLWKDAFIVFDANVLLNLYRYRKSTSDELIQVMENIGNRIWIPYQVALEYQRNRLKTISEQSKMFDDVKEVVEKKINSLCAEIENFNLNKRHSVIDPADFMSGLNALKMDFTGYLDGLKGSHLGVREHDSIRARLDNLFANRTGKKPGEQKNLDDIEKESLRRISNRIPPGFNDGKKDKDDTPCYFFDGLTYQKKCGDYVMWHQIVEHANVHGWSDLIFVTDDSKDDWWLRISGETILPRPELVQEIYSKTTVRRFFMYSSQRFLEHVRKMLTLPVSNEAILEVSDIARELSVAKEIQSASSSSQWSAAQAKSNYEAAVMRWLLKVHGVTDVRFGEFAPLKFTATLSGSRIGYSIIPGTRIQELIQQIETQHRITSELIAEKKIDTHVIVLTFASIPKLNSTVEELKVFSDRLTGLRIVVGILSNFDTLDSEWEFAQVHTFGNLQNTSSG